MLHGVRSVDPHPLGMEGGYGMTERRLFMRVVLPARCRRSLSASARARHHG
jgi:ABC-type nitrate/sulfonate/bicarbonate transport system permease component